MAALAADGSLVLAGILVALATVAATAATLRFGAEVPFDQFAFGSGRSPAIGALLELMGLARLPAEAAAAIGGPRGLGATAAQVVGTAALAWLGVVAWRTTRELYGMSGQRAFTALAMAVALFYLAPLGVVVVAGIAILVAAILLDVVPGG